MVFEKCHVEQLFLCWYWYAFICIRLVNKSRKTSLFLWKPVCQLHLSQVKVTLFLSSVHQSFVQNSTKILLSIYGEIQNLFQYNTFTENWCFETCTNRSFSFSSYFQLPWGYIKWAKCHNINGWYNVLHRNFL